MSFESKVNKWNNVKQDNWGEKVRPDAEKTPGTPCHDLLVQRFLRPEDDSSTRISYDQDSRSYEVGLDRATAVYDGYQDAIENGVRYEISGKIEVPADTDISWNEKHYQEAIERIDNSSVYYHVDGDEGEDEEYKKSAYEQRIGMMKSMLDVFFQTALDTRIGDKEKNLAGVIDEQIAKNVNTFQYIASNSDKSEDEKLTKIKEVLDRLSLMKELEGFVLGYWGKLSETPRDDNL